VSHPLGDEPVAVGFRLWEEYRRYPRDEMRARAISFADDLQRRRTVREFSAEPVPEEIIQACIRAAGSAPSGANKQPWHFAVVGSGDMKRRIRQAAEVEERAFYEERAPKAWLDDLAPLGTDANKPFLEIAPWLIVVFAERFEEDESGEKRIYYVSESVGIATGMLISALHQAGLATLTHTPSPMAFLRDILERPKNERPFLIVVTGYPTADATVPDIERKPFHAIASWWREES
jgi:nitroreductase